MNMGTAKVGELQTTPIPSPQKPKEGKEATIYPEANRSPELMDFLT